MLEAPSRCRAELVEMPPPLLPMSTRDPRVDLLSRSLKMALDELQEAAELDVLEDAKIKDGANIFEMTWSTLWS